MWNNLEQLQCVVHSPLIGGLTIALWFSLGTCIVQTQTVRANFACTKDFSVSSQNRISMSAMWVCVPGAQFSFWDQRNSFFLPLAQGVYIFEESPKSVQDVIGDVFCHCKYCSNREKCESLGVYVTTPRSIYACGKFGAWLFANKLPFMLQEHEKTTKTDKKTFLLLKKDELGTQQTTIT